MNALNNKDILMKRVIQLSCLTMMMTRNLTTVSFGSDARGFEELDGTTLISIPRGGKVINGVTLATVSKETSRAESGGKVSLNFSGVYVNETVGRIETYKGYVHEQKRSNQISMFIHY